MDDPFFGSPFVDFDESRDAPVPHRYVHGGFEGTDTRFSFYFPPAEQWRGRLLQVLEGGNGGHENTAQGPVGGGVSHIAFAAATGCYLVESNQGHFGDDMRILLREPTVGAYRRLGALPPVPRTVPGRLAGRSPVHHGALDVVVARLLGAGARGACPRTADGVRDRRGGTGRHGRSVRRLDE